MKKFLIATILVLSCSTANAEDVYVQFRDSTKSSPELDNAWRSLVRALDSNLRKQGHTSTKKWSSTQLGVMLESSRRVGSRPSVTGTNYCLVKNGSLKWMGNVPLNGSRFDTDWMARKILENVGLD